MKEKKKSQKKSVEEKETRSSDILTIDDDPAADFLIVGIGASAGGFEAFQTFLKNMPAATGMAFVFVPHLDPTHESLMPELLDRLTEMSVQQIKNSTRAEPNNVYIIPPNKTLTIERGVLRLKPPAQTRGLRLPIDAFFHSLAEDQKENAVGVILSGSGSDGAIGIKAIKEFGGVIFAQEIETSKYDGMPRSAITTGLVDFVFPVEDIPQKLIEFSKHRENLQNGDGTKSVREEMTKYLQEICLLLRRETGHDFLNYKHNTLVRRIQRRIQVAQTKSVSEYVGLMRADKKEVVNLFKDLLIGVTHFFRDREAFEVLKSRVIPQIVDSKSDGNAIRVWVPGCATGEEAYSIAMLLCERMTELNVRIPTQIFATDIDDDALERARQGRYPDSIAEQMPTEYLEKFFTKRGNVYQVSKSLREMCLFSQHNLIKHPPFSRLDLVSCRNLLIYLDGNLQKKILPVFHYSLRPNGFLFLGTSESLSGYSDLFRTIDKHNRVFQAKDTALGTQVTFPITDSVRLTRPQFNRPKDDSKKGDERQVGKIIENILLEDYAPACVIVNERADVVYFFGHTGKYLEPASGTPTNNILELARKGLRLDLRTALHKATASKTPVTHENITVETGDDLVQRINLKIRPMLELGDDSGLFLIIFQDVGKTFSPEETSATDTVRRTDDPAVKQLEAELRTTKEHLQTTIEELETSNEELKSSNEELLSMNEELQSSNEELQTSKEEMQSINEELETVNAELRVKVEELNAANSDLQNFFQSTNIATIFLNQDLRIKKFTPATTEIFNLIESDSGRPITDIMPRLEGVNLRTDVKEALKKLKTIEREVSISDKDEHFMMRVAPYRTIDNVIDGVVITFVNISDIRTAKQEAEKRARQQSAIAELGLFSVQNSDLQAIFDKACSLGKEILETDFVKILELLPDEKELKLVSGIGWREGLIGNENVGADLDSQAGYTLRSNAPVVVKDLREEIRFHGPPLLNEHKVVSGMSVVIHGRKKPYGVFGTHTLETREFTQQEVNFLQSFANIIAAAVQREKNLDALRKSEKHLRRNNDTFYNLVQNTPFGIYVVDSNFQLVQISAGSKKVFSGIEPLIGRDFAEILRIVWEEPFASEAIEHFRHTLATGETYHAPDTTEQRGNVKDTESYDWKIERIILPDGQFGVVCYFYDLTELMQAKKAVEEADRRKNEFLAMLGHELRNPLAPLKNSLTLLNSGVEEKQFERLHDVMERQINQMSRLVDDLLDVSRISHGKIKLQREPIELKNLLRDLKNDVRVLIENRELHLELALPDKEIWVEGDVIRLTQAIGNVITNAIKFSPRGCLINIRLKTVEKNIILSVKDKGIGMSNEALGRIFESFTQENTELDRTRGGLGLGLALAKGLIEMHSGKIYAESEGENKGSTFTIELPLISEPKPTIKKLKKTEPSKNGSRRVLIIEDNADSAETLKILLEMSDHKVETAAEGQSGIAKALKFSPDVIICDIGLPGGMSGYDVITELKKNKKLASVYFIALSGYGQIEDKEKSAEVGFHAHLVKPVDSDVLIEMIGKS